LKNKINKTKKLKLIVKKDYNLFFFAAFFFAFFFAAIFFTSNLIESIKNALFKNSSVKIVY
jgi:hypothetical protein